MCEHCVGRSATRSFYQRPWFSGSLAVINELDGLSSELISQKYASADHGKIVKEEATKSVAFLDAEFESRNTRLKALTTSGTELDTITYRNEESSTIVCSVNLYIYWRLIAASDLQLQLF